MDRSDVLFDRPASVRRGGHSTLEALELAEAARGAAASVFVVPLLDPAVKIIARDTHGAVVFYTECVAADAGLILERLGVRGPEQEITDLTATFQADGVPLLDAVRLARALRASEAPTEAPTEAP